MSGKACSVGSVVFAVLALLGILATGFLLVNDVWADVVVYGVLTILYGYLAISCWSGIQGYEIIW